jgi:hypothetical protein
MTVGEMICAVNVTGWPKLDGFSEDVIVAALVVGSTLWFSTEDVLPRLFVSPAYTAVRG